MNYKACWPALLSAGLCVGDEAQDKLPTDTREAFLNTLLLVLWGIYELKTDYGERRWRSRIRDVRY